jgi:two-component system cell cycle sensor histidine kinase/response regulator CckA
LEQAAKTQMEADLAKEKLETVGMLAEGIAHDFNNLLAAVLAHAELAKAQLAEGSNPKEELQRIETMVLQGTEIVRQLMTYAGQESEVFEVVSISGIIEDLLALLKVSASKNVRVEFDLRKDIPAVRANPTQIRQMVMNLFTNASDAIGDRNGLICMSAGRVTLGPDSSLVAVEGLAVGDYVQLQVSDTGHGMTPAVQARIFDPLFTTKATGSHGYGLVVVKRIVDDLHGFISVSSEPGRGTTLQILLPGETHEVQTVPALGAGSPLNEFRSQATILVVEDEELLREAVSKILRKNGFAVLEVNDGSAALDMLRKQKSHIDVLLLDVTLPGASSRQVYEEAKRLKPELAVIVTSAKSKETAGASLATGIEHFLRKPFSTVDLIAMIHRLVSSRAQVAAN